MQNQPSLARRDVIANRLDQGQSVMAAALATEFGVSEDAIRRDLRALAAEGRCRRVYGGALPIVPGVVPMADRIDDRRGRKAALARTAATLVQPGEFIFLDSGSTNLALAGFLSADLRIATNSIDIAAAILRRQDLQLTLIGGTVNPLVGGCVDAGAIQSIASLNIDRCFLGACAISLESGISATDPADALFKRTLLEASTTTLILATTDKFETRAPYRIAPLEEITQLVVEHDTAIETVKRLQQAGVTVHQADRSE